MPVRGYLLLQQHTKKQIEQGRWDSNGGRQIEKAKGLEKKLWSGATGKGGWKCHRSNGSLHKVNEESRQSLGGSKC